MLSFRQLSRPPRCIPGIISVQRNGITNAGIILETAAWIETRLRDELLVPDVARRAGYSLHHFIRLFGAVVGIGPKEYIVRRKLSEAARELRKGTARVTDVAFEYGFNDLETFTRAFKRELGCTPSAVRRGASFPYLDAIASPRPIDKSIRGGISGEPVAERVGAFFLAGWSIHVTEQTNAVGRLWGRFAGRAASIPRLVLPPRFRQLAWWTEDAEDSVEIMAGTEVRDLTELPIDLVGKHVPACVCLVFTHRGSMTGIGELYRAIYGTWLAAMDRRPVLPFNFERYPDAETDPYSNEYSMEICVPVL